jgi:hypothetical protein
MGRSGRADRGVANFEMISIDTPPWPGIVRSLKGEPVQLSA